MKKISFDSGVQTYKLGQGVLRFHPGDPNLYARFMEGAEQLRAVEQALEEDSCEPLTALQNADRQMKKILNGIFGPGNDFDGILGGVNLLAVAENGERVVTNLFAALEPVLVAGAEQCAGSAARAAEKKAKARRQTQ